MIKLPTRAGDAPRPWTSFSLLVGSSVLCSPHTLRGKTPASQEPFQALQPVRPGLLEPQPPKSQTRVVEASQKEHWGWGLPWETWGPSCPPQGWILLVSHIT